MTSAIQPSMQSGTSVSCFEWEGRTPRVVFGFGRARALSAELALLGATRTLALVTPGGARRYQSWLQTVPSIVGQFAGAQPHCPEEVARAALGQYRALGCDSAVAIGGGSTLGLGKVIAAETGCSFIAVPTTMSGSEMAALYGIKRGDEKRTRTDERARAKDACGHVRQVRPASRANTDLRRGNCAQPRRRRCHVGCCAQAGACQQQPPPSGERGLVQESATGVHRVGPRLKQRRV